jgi:hypothetical protein
MRTIGMLIGVGLLASGCAFGLPTPQIELDYSPAQEACKQYAEAFRDGTNRDTIIAGLERALATAKAATGDDDAQTVASAIDALLTATVVGTNESVATANDEVISVCNAAGAPLKME